NSVSTTLAPTANAAFNLNLNAADTPAVAPAANFTRSLNVYDSLGTQQNLTLTFTKTANNAWTMVTTGGTPVTTVSTPLTFNPNGTLATPAPATVSVAGVNWGNGSAPQ